MDPKSELASIQARVKHIAATAKAAGRELTDAEVDEIELKAARATLLKDAIDRGEANAEVIGRVAALGAGTSESLDGDAFPAAAKSGFLTPANLKSAITAAAKPGVKALVAEGSAVVATELDPNPIPMGQVGFGLLSLIPTKVRSTPKYSYLRETVHTDNAAVVAPGATKPTSVYTVSSFDGELGVVAHLSEYIDKFLLEDNSDLQRFLTAEMTTGVIRKVTKDALATIAGTSGVQSVAFATNAADSILAGGAALAGLGYGGNLIVINDQDYLAIRTSKTTAGEYLGGNVFDGNAMPALWGVTTFVTPDQTAGTALVLDTSAVGLSTDGKGVRVEFDAISHFDKNEVRARVEGRFSTDVFIPAAVAVVALSAD